MMKFLLGLLLLQPLLFRVTANLIGYNLGYIEMKMKSSEVTETNALLRKLLSATVNFLDESFSDLDQFERVSCSIHSYQFGGVVDDDESFANFYYSANITIAGQAFFKTESTVSQNQLSQRMTSAMETKGDFDKALMETGDPFLSNIISAVVKVNGYTVTESSEEEETGASSKRTFGSNLEVWMIALIAGASAFVLVFVIAVCCICCVKIDEHEGINKTPSGVLRVHTKPTGTSYPEDDLESKSPSPVRSITSQDSSVFTYNPKSIYGGGAASTKSRTANSYFSDVDLEAWQNGTVVGPHQSLFGQDLSDIEKKRDLTLIEEETSVTSDQSTPRQKTNGMAKLGSLLNDPASEDMPDDEAHMMIGLTEQAVRQMKISERRTSKSTSSQSSASASTNSVITGSSSTDTKDDVNQALNDLGAQFDQYRGTRGS